MNSYPASLALQKALYERLSTEATLPTIHDGAATGTAFPYITLGEDRVFLSGVDGITQSNHESHIFVYSQHDGMSETKQILDDIHQALTRAPLTIEGHQIILMRVDEMRSQRLNDSKTFRGELILRTLTEPQ